MSIVVEVADVMEALARIDRGEATLSLDASHDPEDRLFPRVCTSDGWIFEVFTDDESPMSGFDYINRYRRPGSDEWVDVSDDPGGPVLWWNPQNVEGWVSLWRTSRES